MSNTKTTKLPTYRMDGGYKECFDLLDTNLKYIEVIISENWRTNSAVKVDKKGNITISNKIKSRYTQRKYIRYYLKVMTDGGLKLGELLNNINKASKSRVIDNYSDAEKLIENSIGGVFMRSANRFSSQNKNNQIILKFSFGVNENEILFGYENNFFNTTVNKTIRGGYFYVDRFLNTYKKYENLYNLNNPNHTSNGNQTQLFNNTPKKAKHIKTHGSPMDVRNSNINQYIMNFANGFLEKFGDLNNSSDVIMNVPVNLSDIDKLEKTKSVLELMHININDIVYYMQNSLNMNITNHFKIQNDVLENSDN